MITINIKIIMQVISELTRKMGGNEEKEEAVFGQIIHVWVSQTHYIFKVERCKLLALALCSLLGANCPPSILKHFPQIISKIVEALNDITTITDNIELGIE